jgi:hypothetical protein
MRCRYRPLLRRCATVFATAQLLAYAVAPIVEAQVERAPGPVAVENGHSAHCVKVHQPATCLACQVTTSRARAEPQSHVPELSATDAPPPSARLRVATTRAPPARPRSRAPPTLAA